jgi:16S rRNA (guanine527-N7)-methyltransferase
MASQVGTTILDPARINSVSGRFSGSTDPRVISQLARFGELFLRWNERINLASARTGPELIERHFADAFAARSFVGDHAKVADVGTGGGLPALPLALLLPLASFDLFEPIAKKAAFLRTAVRELGIADRVRIHVTAVGLPLDAPRNQHELFDVAMSRATFAPAVWLPLGRTHFHDHGRVLVFATDQSVVGLPAAQEVLHYDRSRQLLVYSATGAPP